MAWTINFKETAKKSFSKLDKQTQKKITHYLEDRIAKIIEKAKNNTSRTDVTFSIKASKPRFLVWPLKTAPPDKAFKASCCFCGCIIVAIMISTETMINSVIIKLYNALPPIYSTITLLFYHR